MTTEAIIGIIFASLIVGEALMAACNYHWWWKSYRCRQEALTDELKRHVRKWWWVDLIEAVIILGGFLALLLFPSITYPLWAKITILVMGVLVLAFYGWLLLHLGGIASAIRTKLTFKRRRRNHE